MGVFRGGSGLVGSFWRNLVTVGLIVRWVRWLTIWYIETNKWEFRRSHHFLCPGNLCERHWTWSKLRLCNENFVFFLHKSRSVNITFLPKSRSVNITLSRWVCILALCSNKSRSVNVIGRVCFSASYLCPNMHPSLGVLSRVRSLRRCMLAINRSWPFVFDEFHFVQIPFGTPTRAIGLLPGPLCHLNPREKCQYS